MISFPFVAAMLYHDHSDSGISQSRQGSMAGMAGMIRHESRSRKLGAHISATSMNQEEQTGSRVKLCTLRNCPQGQISSSKVHILSLPKWHHQLRPRFNYLSQGETFSIKSLKMIANKISVLSICRSVKLKRVRQMP